MALLLLVPSVISASLVAAEGAGAAASGGRPERSVTRLDPLPAPAAAIPALGHDWFLLGANVPFLSWRCDFGCRSNGGVTGRRAQVDLMFGTLAARGVHTVRWYLFPGDAWQVRRDTAGFPTGLSRAALVDLDVAVALARKHDVFLVPALFPSPASVPRTWFTVAAQRAALARELEPLFRRYAGNRHVLAWELLTSPEVLVDSGAISAGQARSLALHLRAAVDQAGATKTTVGALDITRLDLWTGLGLDFLAAQGTTTQTGPRCATCTSTTTLAATEQVTEPVVVSVIDAADDEAGITQLRRLRLHGYAGAWFWSWRRATHPLLGEARPRVPLTATWRYGYANPGAGPRSRPLNVCIGPQARDFLCPNLRMGKPTDLSAGTRGGRRVLFSRNSIDNVGRGPASLHGVRNGPRTMAARQVLYKSGGGRLSIGTDAKLLFKAVPGQFRYWKWHGAAQMELWRLDRSGQPVERVRYGAKTVYCLRDLERTHGALAGSPRGRVFPGCSQDPDARERTLGTSVGWSDIYPASYHENWVDITGLRGCFAYVHVGDPTNAVYESNEQDNRAWVVVRLPWTGSNAGCPGAHAIPSTGSNGGY